MIIKFSDQLKRSFDAGIPDEDRLFEIARAKSAAGSRRFSRWGALAAACLALFVIAGALWLTSGSLWRSAGNTSPAPSVQTEQNLLSETPEIDGGDSDRFGFASRSALDGSGISSDEHCAENKSSVGDLIPAPNATSAPADAAAGNSDPLPAKTDPSRVPNEAFIMPGSHESEESAVFITSDMIPDNALSFFFGAGEHLIFVSDGDLLIVESANLSVKARVGFSVSATAPLGLVVSDCGMTADDVFGVGVFSLIQSPGGTFDEAANSLLESADAESVIETLTLWEELCGSFAGLKIERTLFSFDVGEAGNFSLLSRTVSDASL